VVPLSSRQEDIIPDLEAAQNEIDVDDIGLVDSMFGQGTQSKILTSVNG